MLSAKRYIDGPLFTPIISYPQKWCLLRREVLRPASFREYSGNVQGTFKQRAIKDCTLLILVGHTQEVKGTKGPQDGSSRDDGGVINLCNRIVNCGAAYATDRKIYFRGKFNCYRI